MLKIQTLRGRVHSPQGAHSITGLLKALDPVKTTAWWKLGLRLRSLSFMSQTWHWGSEALGQCTVRSNRSPSFHVLCDTGGRKSARDRVQS